MTTHRINAYLNKLQLIGVLSHLSDRNPSATDWAYPVPTLWVNESSDAAYLLVDNAENAAVWTEIIPSDSSFTQGNDALSFYDITTARPGSPTAGDAYILSSNGVRDTSWTDIGATYKDFVIYDGASWKVSSPAAGSVVYVDELKQVFIYADSTWKSLHELLPFDFQESVLSITDNTAPPPTTNAGDRYILDTTAGTVNAAWDGAAKSDLVEYDGVEWHALTPTEGMMTSVEDVNTVYIYVAGWSPLVTSTSLLVNGDTGTFEPNGSGEMSILGDSTSGINVVGDNANTGTVSADQATTSQRGTLETATDGEAQAKSDTDKALVPGNLAALGSSENFSGLIEIATNAEADAGVATDKAVVPSNLPTAVPANVPAASTTVEGKIEIATDAEAQAKTATDKALVPSNLAALGASDTFAGLIEIATDAEAIAQSATDRALVPSNLAALGASETVSGLLEIATDAEALAQTATDKALVPSNLAALIASETQSGILETATDAEAVAASVSNKIVVPSNLGPVFASPPALGSTAAAAVNSTTLNSTVTSATTNAPITVQTIEANTSGTAANGIGPRQVWRSEDGNGGIQDIGYIDCIEDDVTAASEDASFRISAITAGSIGEVVRFSDAGISTDGGTDFFKYDEGTFTPAFTRSGITFGYSNQEGQYIKIGRSVTLGIKINVNSVSGSGSGDLTIGTLPFTTYNGLSFDQYYVTNHINTTISQGNIWVSASANNSTSILHGVWRWSTGSNTFAVTPSSFATVAITNTYIAGS